MSDNPNRLPRKAPALDAQPSDEGWEVLPEGWRLVEDGARRAPNAVARPVRDEIPAGTFHGNRIGRHRG